MYGIEDPNDYMVDAMGNLRRRTEVENKSREHQQCVLYLREKEQLNVGKFLAWWEKNGTKCVKEKDYTNNTLFQVALYTKPPTAVMLAIFNAWPDAVKETSPNHEEGSDYTCLHLALEDKVKEEVTLSVLKAWPDACKNRDKCGMTPLAYALKHNASLALFRSIFEAHPDAAMNTDFTTDFVTRGCYQPTALAGKGHTLLKLALQHNASDEIVSTLLKKWPDAIKEVDEHGKTALHVRMFRDAPADAVAEHLQSFASDFECYQNLVQGGNRLDAEVFSAWWKDHGDNCITETTEDLCNVLHLALKHETPNEVAMDVLNAWPAGAKEKNKDGQIPLFVALSKDVSEGVLQALLNAWPESVKFQNDNGGIPLQIALASTHPSRGKVLPLLASWSVKVQQQSSTNLNLLT